MKKADVVLNVYGKPYNTAVTILSLLKHSGDWIDKIYFIEEPKQPAGTDFKFLFDLLGEHLVYFKPKHWLWINQINKSKLQDESYRLSIRYQYGWEKSDKDFLFIMHNDVLYKGDIIKLLLDNMGDAIGIGRIGQCGNCPAHSAKLCHRTNYWDFRPTKEELKKLLSEHPSRRSASYDTILEKDEAWPLPECRLNEWVALINLKKAKPVTIPFGKAMAYGAYDGLDLATRWFYDVSHMGYQNKHIDFTEIAHHAWSNVVMNGHSALFDKDMYNNSELTAKKLLMEEFGLREEQLKLTKKSFWSKLLRR